MVALHYDQENGVANGAAHSSEPVDKMNGQNESHSTIPTNLVLDHPTPEEIQNQAKLNGTSWRGALTPEAYLRREQYLSTQGIAKTSGMTHWILCDPTKNGQSRNVLAGCESLRKRAIISRNGKMQDVIAHGVGSVFTPPAFRGHGYGAVMMQKLASELKQWQTDDLPCLFSILYSDIGKKFYEKNGGWRPFPSAHIHLRPEPSSDSNLQLQAKPLFEDDLPHLCAVDEAMVRTNMAQRQQGTAVALIPDHETMAWHHARENFVSNELHGRRPMVKGAIAQIGDDRVWCIFSRLWYNEDPKQSQGNTMHILRLVVENSKRESRDSGLSEGHLAGIVAVLRFAQREAHEWNMGEIEMWNPPQSTIDAAKMIDPKVKVVERESESIASLLWYGSPEAEIEWLESEKFGWC